MKIICLGDSITAPFALHSEDMWVSHMQRETEDEWINAGICGDTTGGMLARLSAEVFPQKPDVVFLMCGGNDLLLTGSCEQPKLNLMGMVHQCVARGVRPVIGIAPLIYAVPAAWHPVTHWEDITEVNREWARYQRLFCKTFGLRHIDFAELFEQYAPGSLQSDGLHPNRQGNRLMADLVLSSPVFHYAK